nr:MAG TPA: ESSS subunit of NADH:ubiquinone oxidoreductase (complex I) [Caudoviricetes sp.]
MSYGYRYRSRRRVDLFEWRDITMEAYIIALVLGLFVVYIVLNDYK